MVDWNAILQTLLTSSVVAGTFGAIYKKYTEKSIEHTFDRKLKEYEAQLHVTSELLIEMGRDRIREYRRLSALIRSCGRRVADLYDDMCNNRPPSSDEVNMLKEGSRELEQTLYHMADALQADGIYEQVHAYKTELKAFVQNLMNEAKLRSMNDTDRADRVHEQLVLTAKRLSDDRNMISNLVSMRITPQHGNMDPDT